MKKFITMCLVAIMIVGLLTVCVNAMQKPDIVGYDTYTVRSGDTLWAIAQESNGWNRMDAYEIINDIEEASDCSSLIHPGDVVYIPIYDFD